ncbi:hypothetical protein BDZ45DRAFT_696934 [Acephala macrosclerotiorum]|nr:hypothetical protein BDZ45DRAFT_696934 [Acephala macrosclerotiorum]
MNDRAPPPRWFPNQETGPFNMMRMEPPPPWYTAPQINGSAACLNVPGQYNPLLVKGYKSAHQHPGITRAHASKLNSKDARKKKKAHKRRENRPFDPKAPCCECGSVVHQLSGHPNANTPQGYLRGCLICNVKAHSFAQCTALQPGQKLKSLFHYLRRGRNGLAPAEWHGDPREIMKDMGNTWRLAFMPWTPEFARTYRYRDEINFKPPGRNVVGTSGVMFDSFWDSDQAWSNIGCFSNPEARVDAEELRKWQDDTQARHLAIYESLCVQRVEGHESAPTKEQQANWSSIHNATGPVAESQIPLPSVETEQLAHVRYRSTVSPTPSITSIATRRYSPYGMRPQAELEEWDD